jgi:hypothetical protein
MNPAWRCSCSNGAKVESPRRSLGYEVARNTSPVRARRFRPFRADVFSDRFPRGVAPGDLLSPRRGEHSQDSIPKQPQDATLGKVAAISASPTSVS